MLDYKTGGFWRDDWKGVFNGGRRLQHALYGLAAVELLQAHVQEAEGHRRRLLLLQPQGRQGARADRRPDAARRSPACSRDLREVIVQGAFVHAPDEDDCKCCDYDAACGARRARAGRGASWRTRSSTAFGGWRRMTDSRVDRRAVAPRSSARSCSTNILVEAGAGSGKTQMLAERMAAGIASGVYQVEHMAAVTFTRKAASELRGRFHLALESGCCSPARRGRAPRRGDAARLQRALWQSRALLRRHHPLVLRAPAARAAGRVRRVARLHRAGRGAGRRAAQARLARLHRQRARRRRSATCWRCSRPACSPKDLDSRVRDDLRQRGRRVPARRRRSVRIRSRRGRRSRRSGRSCRSTCRPADRRRTRRARSRRRRASSAAQLRVSQQAARSAVGRSPTLLDTWDCESKIIQKWWADTAAEKKRLRDLIEPLHADFRDGDGRAVPRRSGASMSIGCRSRC